MYVYIYAYIYILYIYICMYVCIMWRRCTEIEEERCPKEPRPSQDSRAARRWGSGGGGGVAGEELPEEGG
jgi:hypothetical protein